jgi:hypothetical protein
LHVGELPEQLLEFWPVPQVANPASELAAGEAGAKESARPDTI